MTLASQSPYSISTLLPDISRSASVNKAWHFSSLCPEAENRVMAIVFPSLERKCNHVCSRRYFYHRSIASRRDATACWEAALIAKIDIVEFRKAVRARFRHPTDLYRME